MPLFVTNNKTTKIHISLHKWVFADISELKVFVDLASISAGENDLDVDRVACFHDAILGYSSILYGLKEDSDFEDFMVAVSKLWMAFENDRNIPWKLVRFHPSCDHHTASDIATTIKSHPIKIVKMCYCVYQIIWNWKLNLIHLRCNL